MVFEEAVGVGRVEEAEEGEVLVEGLVAGSVMMA